jgi:hypothetical protein
MYRKETLNQLAAMSVIVDGYENGKPQVLAANQSEHGKRNPPNPMSKKTSATEVRLEEFENRTKLWWLVKP